jgi:carbon dioxide concentrating mechanism protein CcmO
MEPPATYPDAIGILETTGLTPAIVALDAMEKRAGIRLLQAELNDFLGVCLKVTGRLAAVREAINVAREVADRMGGRPVVQVISRPDPRTRAVLEPPVEFNPLIQQNVVWIPRGQQHLLTENLAVAESEAFALGFIETQGFTAVFEAIDTACKAANVQVVAKEKLGGGYVTVIIKGDVAAVKAAVDAGQQKVEGLGKLIAAHVIPRPSASVLSLLP